jgi:hypothetical protein
MYHSSASLTAKGWVPDFFWSGNLIHGFDRNVMVAGSIPRPAVILATTFPTEFRVEYLNPDFITNNAPRPVIRSAPTQIRFNQKATLKVTIPPSLLLGKIKGTFRVRLMIFPTKTLFQFR